MKQYAELLKKISQAKTKSDRSPVEGTLKFIVLSPKGSRTDEVFLDICKNCYKSRNAHFPLTPVKTRTRTDSTGTPFLRSDSVDDMSGTPILIKTESQSTPFLQDSSFFFKKSTYKFRFRSIRRNTKE